MQGRQSCSLYPLQRHSTTLYSPTRSWNSFHKPTYETVRHGVSALIRPAGEGGEHSRRPMAMRGREFCHKAPVESNLIRPPPNHWSELLVQLELALDLEVAVEPKET